MDNDDCEARRRRKNNDRVNWTREAPIHAAELGIRTGEQAIPPLQN
ncbi:MAG: hypothetical protein OXL41_06065 [Nitrospinae bacterium]|nr:hypothetical protein [Nitrospinota bacterium]